jgi:hypothetical protein
MVYACHPDHSTIFRDHHGALLIQSGDLEEVANMKSVSNWISYHHENSWIVSLFLSILINFLKAKTDLDFPKLLFKIPSESKGVSMEKVVPIFKIFKIIFYLKILELRKIHFGSLKV